MDVISKNKKERKEYDSPRVLYSRPLYFSHKSTQMRSAVVLNYVLISSTTLVLSRIGRWSNRHRRHLFETFLSNSLFYFFPILFFVFVFYRRSASSTLMRQVFTPRRILLRIISFRRIKSHRGVCLTPGELKKKKGGFSRWERYKSLKAHVSHPRVTDGRSFLFRRWNFTVGPLEFI